MMHPPSFARRHRIVAPIVMIVLGLSALGARAEGDRRTFAVNVVDAQGNQIAGLVAANFRGEFRGQSVKVLSAVPDSSPRRVAVLVDTSGSTSARKKAAFAWSAAEDLIRSLVPSHKAQLFSVGRELRPCSELTDSQPSLLAAVQDASGRKAAGGTALWDGLLQVSQAFTPATLGDVICLISDWEDTASHRRGDEVKILLARSGLRVFAVRLPMADPRSDVLSTAAGWVREITEATGGVVSNAHPGDTVKMLPPFRSFIEQVYRIEVALPRPVDEPREWKLEVVDTGGKSIKGARVVYPHLLAPTSDK